MNFYNPKEFDFQGIFHNNNYISCDEFKKAIYVLTEYLKKNTQKNRSPFIYLIAENHPKTIIAYFAVLQADFSCVLIDPDWKTLEWEYLLSNAPPSAIIKIDQETNYNDFKSDIEFLPDRPGAVFLDKRGYTIVYTAAEDGFAKGALLTQKNIISNALVSSSVNQSKRSSVSCALIPYNHMFGLTMGIVSPLYSNSTILVLDVKKIERVDQFAEALFQHKVTHLYTIPIVLFLLGRSPNIHEQIAHLHTIISGGCKLSASIYNFYIKKFNKIIREGYGLTEASPICSWHYPEIDVKIDSVGQYSLYCQLKIIDKNSNTTKVNQVGEICVRGENVMEGYYNFENYTNEVLKDGWLSTGDYGKVDEDGYLYLTGLKKYMINVGGRNVYPEEVKRMMLMNKNIESVEFDFVESPITGTKMTGKIKLKVNSPETQDNITKWCLSNIAHYKLPKIWKFS
jgi:long-chain acyl-CoA synthetase